MAGLRARKGKAKADMVDLESHDDPNFKDNIWEIESDDEFVVKPTRKRAKARKDNGHSVIPPRKRTGGVLGRVGVAVLAERDPNIQTSKGEVTDRVGDLNDGRVESAPGTDLSGETAYENVRTPWEPEEWIKLLFKSTDRCLPLKDKIREFVGTVRKMKGAEASEDVLDFQNDDEPTEFRSHCEKVDEIWARYAPKLAKICGSEVASLAKPSGPLMATLSIMWHYPTFTTNHPQYGMVFDDSNGCLRMQKAKIGASRQVLTFDAYPMRYSMPKTGNFYDNLSFWEEYKAEADQLRAELSQYAKFRLVLGKDNNFALAKELERDNSIILTKIDIQVKNGEDKGWSKAGIWNKTAQLFVIQDKDTKEIKQMILPSFHLMTFMKTGGMGLGSRFCDATWNICAAVAGLDAVNVDYFDWKANRVDPGTKQPNWTSMLGGPLDLVKRMVGWENSHNDAIPEDTVRAVFEHWLKRPENTNRLDTKNGTLARQILLVISEEGLAKGRATRLDPSWIGTEGHQKQKENAARNLAKSLATRLDPSWIGTEGHKRLQAGALKGSAKGHAAMLDPSWIGTEGHQRQQKALAKGRATRLDPNWIGTEGHKRQQAGALKGAAKKLDPSWIGSEGNQKQMAGLAHAKSNYVAKHKAVNDAQWEALETSGKIKEWAAGTKRMKNRAQQYEDLTNGPYNRRRTVLKNWSRPAKGCTILLEFYSAETPEGIRWKGDGGPGDDGDEGDDDELDADE